MEGEKEEDKLTRSTISMWHLFIPSNMKYRSQQRHAPESGETEGLEKK
jgi:hypothetical protein